MTTRGERIKQERRRRKLTQAELARDAGVVLKTLQRIEQGRVSDSKEIVTLLDHLGLTHAAPVDAAELTDQESEALAGTLPTHVLFAEIGRRVSQIPGVGSPAVRGLPSLGGPATMRTDKGPDRAKGQTGEPDTPDATESNGQEG